MWTLAIVNMLLLLLGFFMQLHKQKRDRVSQPRLTLPNNQLTEPEKG
jgi:hypothetical protein